MSRRIAESGLRFWPAAALLLWMVQGPSLQTGWGEEASASPEDVLFVQLPVFVSASRSEHILKSVSSVAVIDEKMIRDYHFATVSEAVAGVAGMDVIRTPFMNTVPMARGVLQYHYANKTLVMVNNVPSWFTTTGEGFLNRVDIHDVKQIEVLKGPASVLYGSNAYSGVVNILLKEPKREGRGGQMHIGVGSDGLYTAGGQAAHARNDFSLSLFANSTQEGGHNIRFKDEAGEEGNLSDIRSPKGGNFSLSSRFREHSILFNAYKDEFLALEGSEPSFAAGGGKPQRRDGYFANYAFARSWQERFDLKYSITYDWNQREFSRKRDDGLFTKTSGYRVQNVLKSALRFGEALELELGGDYEYRWSDFYKNYDPHTGAVDSYSNILDRHVYEYSGFGQVGWARSAVKMTLGTRLTRNELFGENLSSRGTLVCMLSENHSLKFIAGQSFRAPSIFELYVLTASRLVKGNPNLSPETSDSVEVAYLGSFHRLFLQLLGYEARYKGRIERRSEDVLYDDGVLKKGVRVYENGQDFKARGVELEAGYRNPALIDAFSNLSYITSDDGEEANFRFVPDYTAVGGVSKELFRNFSLSGTVSHRGKTRGRLADIRAFTTADLHFGWRPGEGRMRHVFSIRNVTDEQVYFPEYVRQTGNFLNAVPSEARRIFTYTFTVDF